MPFYITIPNKEDNRDENIEFYKLEVSPIFKRKLPFFGEELYPIQRKVYFAGIKIKNISSKVTPEGRVSDFGFKQSSTKLNMIDHELEVLLPKLNPNKSIKLWWPDPISISFSGEAMMFCDMSSDDSNSKYHIFQRCEYAKTTGDLQVENSWNGPVHVRSVFEHKQEWTNRLILLMTLVMLLISFIKCS